LFKDIHKFNAFCQHLSSNSHTTEVTIRTKFYSTTFISFMLFSMLCMDAFCQSILLKREMTMMK